jgi:flagellar motor switch protein FliM
MRIVCLELQTAWRALPLEFQSERRQYTSQAQQLMPVDERNLCLSFEIVLNEFRGTMSLAIPAVLSGALLRQLSASQPAENSSAGASGSVRQLRRLLPGCRFRVELGFQTSAAAGELAALAPGKILRLSRRIEAGADLLAHGFMSNDSMANDLMSTGSPIFRAEAARVGNLRAAQIISPIDDTRMGKDRGRT